MPILHLSHQQIIDVTTLMNSGLADMDVQEKEGDLYVDGYTADDLNERQRLKESAVQVKEILSGVELYSAEKDKQAIKLVSQTSATLAYAVLAAFAAETGVAKDERLMESTAIRDLLTNIFHLSASHSIDLNKEYEAARKHWEAETSDDW